MLSPPQIIEFGALDPRSARRRRRAGIHGTLLYLADLDVIAAPQSRLSAGWRCEVVACRHRARPDLRIHVTDRDIAASMVAPRVVPSAGLPIWQTCLFWQAWTYVRWHGPRIRHLCRILAEQLRTPGTLTVDLNANAVWRILSQLNLRPPALRMLLRHLVADGALTPLTPARHEHWGRHGLLLPVPPDLLTRIQSTSLPRPPARGVSRLLVATAVAVLALGSTACTRTGDAAPPEPTADRPTSVPVSTPADRGPAQAARAALAAYRGMWDAYQEAGRSADPDEPDLRSYATGGALETLVDGLRSMRQRDLVVRGQIVLEPRVTGLAPPNEPTTVEITDCADDSRALLYRRSGGLHNDKPGGRRLVLATVTDTGAGVWKVSSFGAREVGTC